ncbi:MAG: site-specific integrase, partial [Planctomycetaceae bacterium]|nr:site-specific integrase [Planctomycetaceae bacterium]
MALEKSNNKSYRVTWKTNSNGKRSNVRISLGATSALSHAKAQVMHDMIMGIRTTITLNQSLDSKQISWLATISPELHNRLAAKGLVRERLARRTPDEYTLKKVIETYTKARSISTATESNQKQAFGFLQNYFESLKDVREITAARAKQFAAQLPKCRSKGVYATSTVSGHLKKISALFNWLVDDKYIESNPFAGIKKPMTRKLENDYYVSEAEAAEYIAAQNDPQWAAILTIGRYCGIRGPSDIIDMQSKHVDFEKKTLIFPSRKNGDRKCPLFWQTEEVFKWLCQRQDDLDPQGYLFIDNPAGGHGKANAWSDVRMSGDLKDLNLRTTPRSRYQKVTGKSMCTKIYKNMRASRVTDLRKRYGEDTHDVCSWIGHSEEVSNSSYMMMFENDYPRAADLGRTAKGNKSGSPSFGGDKMGDTMPSPSLSTQLSDAPQDRLMKGRAQHQPVQGTLLLQELTTLLHSNPVATDLLLSSISKT